MFVVRASYTPEQKARAIGVHNETKSCVNTIRTLGHPSRHVLFNCARNPNPKPKPRMPDE